MLSKNELKVIKSLKVKKYRVREKCFLVEGTKNVLELLDSDFDVNLILGTEQFFEINKPQIGNTRIEVVREKDLEAIGSFVNNNSCIAVSKMKGSSMSIDYSRHIFVLDGVSDPGNLGTIIRTLDWFGFDQLVCSKECADFYNPKVISSTMGSFTRVKIWYVDLGEFYQQNPNLVYGMEMNGVNMYDQEIKNPSVIVMGSESHGLSKVSMENADESITIPRSGKAESLNVGIATGLVASYLRMS